MMTCVSERSGIASSGMCRVVQTAAATATAVSSNTRIRLRALNSMIFSTMRAPSVGCVRLLERGERGPETRLRVDEEVRGGHDLVALGEAGEDLVVSFRRPPERHRARLEPAVADDHEHDLLPARVEHRL